jgi:hypothetical protein
MAKFKMVAFQKKKHETAFELYQEPDAEGRKRSNATIAAMLGVSSSAVANWRKRDEWDNKIAAGVDIEVEAADSTNKAIKKALRDGLHRHILSLNNIIANAKSSTDKLNAIKAFVHIAKELEVLTPDTGAEELVQAPVFKDDIPHGPAEPSSEGAVGTNPSPDGEGGSAGGTSGADPVYPVHSAGDPAALDQSVPDDDVGGLDGGASGGDDDLEHLFRAAGL